MFFLFLQKENIFDMEQSVEKQIKNKYDIRIEIDPVVPSKEEQDKARREERINDIETDITAVLMLTSVAAGIYVFNKMFTPAEFTELDVYLLIYSILAFSVGIVLGISVNLRKNPGSGPILPWL